MQAWLVRPLQRCAPPCAWRLRGYLSAHGGFRLIIILCNSRLQAKRFSTLQGPQPAHMRILLLSRRKRSSCVTGAVD